MSSPLIIKKARASLKSSISDFLDVEEFSPNGKAGSHISFENPPNVDELIEELGEKRSESPVDPKEEFTGQTFERIKSIIAKTGFDQETKIDSKVRILRRLPLSIHSSPETYKPSKYFQKLSLHETENLMLFNLENQIQISAFGPVELRFDSFGTKSAISAASIGNGKLKDIIIYSDFTSKLNLRHFESKSISRSWNLPNDQTSSHLKMKEEIIYCGLSDGRVVLFDLRMKAPLSILQGSDNSISTGIFDPVTSIEPWDEYKLMTSSSSKVSIWDLRASKTVASHSEVLSKIPKACMLNPASATVAFYSDDTLKIHSFENEEMAEIKMDNQIEDILFIPKLNEILLLVSSLESNSFLKAHTHIYSIENSVPSYVDKLDMTEDYSHLLYNDISDKLIAVGHKHFSVWNYFSHDDEKIIKKYFQTGNN